MKAKVTLFFSIVISNLVFSADSSPQFLMTITTVSEPSGFMLNGTYLQGRVESGCIKKGDSFQVMRHGEVLKTASASISEIIKSSEPDSEKRDFARMLIDGEKGLNIQPGDVVMSNSTSCN